MMTKPEWLLGKSNLEWSYNTITEWLNQLRLEGDGTIPAILASDRNSLAQLQKVIQTALDCRATAAFESVIFVIPCELFCPQCNFQHVDEGEWATRPHRKHLCTNCLHEWQPYPVATAGIVSQATTEAHAALRLALPVLKEAARAAAIFIKATGTTPEYKAAVAARNAVAEALGDGGDSDA